VSTSGSFFRLPEGKPEKGKTSIQAVIRELREENKLWDYDVRYPFKFHESKIFKIRVNEKPIPSNEIHYFDLFEPEKQMEVKISQNTLKILEIYYELK
jgi:8-oxo-dGTP diphosphatase